MDTKPRLTKQGIKDLNHYGPKPVRASAGNPNPESADEVKASPPVAEKKPDVPAAVDA
jgi:hypothetical protein